MRGFSRKEKVLFILQKEPGRKFSLTELWDKLSFNSVSRDVKNCLEALLIEQKIESELQTTPDGIVTLYFVKNTVKSLN